MSDHRAEFAVKRMCRTLGVSTSGYYAWCQREPSTRSCADETLKRRIMEIHQGSRGTYGVPRIYAELRRPNRHPSAGSRGQRCPGPRPLRAATRGAKGLPQWIATGAGEERRRSDRVPGSVGEPIGSHPRTERTNI